MTQEKWIKLCRYAKEHDNYHKLIWSVRVSWLCNCGGKFSTYSFLDWIDTHAYDFIKIWYAEFYDRNAHDKNIFYSRIYQKHFGRNKED